MWKAVILSISGGQWAVAQVKGGYNWGMALDNEMLTGSDVFATAELAARDMLAEAGKFIIWHDGYRLLDLCRERDLSEKIKRAG